MTEFVERMSVFTGRGKKQIKFLVDLHLEELSSVPFVSGVIFAKLRLLQGGSFKRETEREEIVDHRVRWNRDFDFEAKLTATAATGILDSAHCRVSVRRDLQGGRSFQKLGFADINLAEFAGGTAQSRSYLLEEYTSLARANNALLRVTLCMRVKEGDFCFRVPAPHTLPLSEGAIEARRSQPSTPPTEREQTHSRQSSSSDSGVIREASGDGYGSLERNSAAALERVGSSRVEGSRVDAESVVEEVLREAKLEECVGTPGGLTLYIARDGSAAVVGD